MATATMLASVVFSRPFMILLEGSQHETCLGTFGFQLSQRSVWPLYS